MRVHRIRKGIGILARRVRSQGIATTLVWAYARLLPKLTGAPLMRFSQVTPQLYVGPQFRRSGMRRLTKLGFTHCVNMRIEYDDAAHDLVFCDYRHLPTVDDTAPSMEHLEQGVAFIREAISQNGKVYIHCAGGVGRAPTMAAAYLISEDCTVNEALEMIRRGRRFIYVMPPQMERLKEFEAMLRGQGQQAHTPSVTVSLDSASSQAVIRPANIET